MIARGKILRVRGKILLEKWNNDAIKFSKKDESLGSFRMFGSFSIIDRNLAYKRKKKKNDKKDNYRL